MPNKIILLITQKNCSQFLSTVEELVEIFTTEESSLVAG